MEIRVADVMTTKIIQVRPDSLVIDAVNKMIKAGIGNVLILSNGKLKGILTEKDILTKIVSKGIDPKKCKVSSVMTKKVITARPSMTIQEAARKMINEGIRRIPVIDKGKLIGIITSNDLLRVQPGLIDILIEKYKYSMPHFADTGKRGICENCNAYSNNLIRINGIMVCPKCKKKV